jgi:hypothetical protein
MTAVVSGAWEGGISDAAFGRGVARLDYADPRDVTVLIRHR